MAKKRYLNTKFWDDPYIRSLTPLERYLFLYLITNSNTTISGIYELMFERIVYDTNLRLNDVSRIVGKFAKDNKIYYIDNYICIKNFIKHQNLNPSITKGIINELKTVPRSIINKISKKDTEWGQTVTRLLQTV